MFYKCNEKKIKIFDLPLNPPFSLTYLRGLEVPELNEEDMPMI